MRLFVAALICLVTGCEQHPVSTEAIADEGNLIALALVEISPSDARKFVVLGSTRCSWLDAALSEDQGHDPFAPAANPDEEPEARARRLLADLLDSVGEHVDDSLVRRFVDLNLVEHDLSSIRFPQDVQVTLADWEELDRLAPPDPADAETEWRRFQAAHPDSYGFTVFSRLVLSDDETVAVLHYSQVSGHLAGGSGFLVFRRVGDHWVSRSIPVGVS